MQTELKKRPSRVSPKTVLVALLLLIGGISATTLYSRREPVYEGKPLSAWVREVGRPEGQRVIRTYATNDLPALIRIMTRKESGFSKSFKALMRQQRFIRIDTFSAEAYSWNAGSAFMFLGTRAKAAIPQLARVLESEEPQSIKNNALRAILGIETEAAILPLTKALTNSEPEIRAFAARGLRDLYKDARSRESKKSELELQAIEANRAQIILFLENNLKNIDPKVRASATNALAFFAEDKFTEAQTR
jgi:HEAT repeat protein